MITIMPFAAVRRSLAAPLAVLKITALAAFALAFALAPLSLAAQENQAASEAYGDWFLVCSDAAQGEGQSEPPGKICALGQNHSVTDQESGASMGRLLGLGLAHDKQAGLTSMTVSGPLGVDLGKGLVLAIDENEPVRLPFHQCTQAGCMSNVTVADDFIQTMRQGNMLLVTFWPYGGAQAVQVNGSLKGFTKGYQALVDGGS